MRARAGLAVVAAVALGGCTLIYGDDDDSAAGGEAPRIDSSFPGPSVQDLERGGSIEFSARGADADSLDLDWSFALDGAFVAGGDVGDGAFDVAWTMEFEEALAGSAAEVVFSVSDGSFVTLRTWSVQVAP